jgi:hypothetical protein
VGANDAAGLMCVTVTLYFLSGALSYAWLHRPTRALIVALCMSWLGIAIASWYVSRRITIDFGVDGPVQLAGAYALWVAALGALSAIVGWLGWWAGRLTRK